MFVVAKIVLITVTCISFQRKIYHCVGYVEIKPCLIVILYRNKICMLWTVYHEVLFCFSSWNWNNLFESFQYQNSVTTNQILISLLLNFLVLHKATDKYVK